MYTAVRNSVQLRVKYRGASVGRGEGKARLEGTTFGLEGGIPVIRRIRERRKTDGSWPGLDGRTDERASERTERRTLKREKTTSECDRDMAGAEEWGGRETRSERERERESQADGDRGMGWVRGIE